MADPTWTDAERDDLHDGLGYSLGLAAWGRTAEYFLHPQNGSWLVETSDENAHTYLSNWLITAGRKTASTSSSDVDANGWVYWTLTDENPGAGQGRLQGFNDSARSVLVTTGSAADGATITLAAQTGYTLAGTVLLGTPVANFNFRTQLIIPPIKRILSLFDGTIVDDDQIRARGEAILRNMRAGAATMKAAGLDFARFFMTTHVRRQLPAITDQSLIIDPRIRQVSGVVTTSPRGLAEDLRTAQADNTGGSGAIEAAAATGAGAVSYGGAWSGSAETPTYGQRVLAATITGVCVKGLDSTAPEFLVTRKPTDTRRAPGDGTESEVLTAPARRLRIGALWAAPEWGISSLTIDYLPTVTNDGGTTLFTTTATLWSVTGMTDANSDGGKLWATYQTSDSTLRFYKSEAGRDDLDADELVAQKTSPGDSTAFTTETNDSGLTVSGTTGATLALDDEGDVDFNAPAPEAPSAYFTITVTESTEGGEWVKQFRDGLNWYPNTGAGLDIVDGQIKACLPMIHAGVLGDRD